MALRYTTVVGFCDYLYITRTVPDKDTPDSGTVKSPLEEVGTGDGSTTRFFLKHLGVIESTYTLYYGANAGSVTALTETTHYTIDLDNSEITITASGLSTIGGNKIFAKYKYNILELMNDEISNMLYAAENRVLRKTEQYFADATDTDPAYRLVTNEVKEGGYDARDKVYETSYLPIVNLSTTVNGAFTLGETTLTLTDGSGFPNAATIYIGGNKVSYTARSTNDLTVPNTTPTIADGATVRGEVVEISKEAEGNSPSYTVLGPDTEYNIDYMNGKVQILDNAYWGELTATDALYPSNYLTRLTYFAAWHEENENPEIPQDILEVTYMICARKLGGRVIMNAHGQGLNEFQPRQINIDKDEIDEILANYQPLFVGSSSFNKQNIS